MKPTAKVFEFLNQYNYYLPQNLEHVQKMFYEQMVQHLQLGDSFKNSFISQISQINQKAQREPEFRQLIRNTWFGFVNKTPINIICPMVSQQEVQDVQDFILKVLLEPQSFEIIYVDDLLSVYEAYFQSNKGIVKVYIRNRFRMIISRLICSKFVKQLDTKYQSKFNQFLFQIYLKKIETQDQNILIQTEFLTESNFYQKMVEQLFDISELQGNFSYIIKNVIQILVREIVNVAQSFEIFIQFYHLYNEKDNILFEKYDQRLNIDLNKLATEIFLKFKENQNLRESIRIVFQKISLNQSTDYKRLLKDLVSKDIYNKENEQWVSLILREYEYQIQRNRKQPPVQNDFQTYLRHQGFIQKTEKKGEQEYDNPKFNLIIHDSTNFTLYNKMNKETKKFMQIKEVYHYIQNSIQNFNN
ncbi:unnamed protein product [Paramecium primaurelia]|uniref:Uncharacterized protein n=1 Tax=Paramecium primaurelia TaxID=5886 RepID=A0A8S1N140_PARPR|nr:unnamed protein product [Paramecium primaurelia]